VPLNTVSTLSSLLPTNVVTAEYLRMLAPRDASLMTHPALVYAGDCRGLGQISVKMSHLGLDGYRRLSARAPGAAMVPIAVDDDETAISVSPYGKSYEFEDLALAVSMGKINPAVLARDAIMATGNTMVELIASLLGGFSNASGTPGSALTAAQLLGAKGKLASRDVPGPYIAVLSGIQMYHFEQSIAASTAGAIQWMPATQEQLEAYGTGFRGTWAGIAIFVTTLVPTANAGVDHAGGMFGRGAILWANSSFAPELDPNIVDFGAADDSGRNPLRFERVRTGLAGKTAFATHANLGVAEGIDNAGESIITKATV